MAMISLRISVVDQGATRTMQFDGSQIVYDVCKDIQDKLGETAGGSDHGLFMPDDDFKRGKWLNPGRTLDYYDLKSGDLVEYKKKHRAMRVILMDESQRTVLIDDSQNVGQIIRSICARINLSNPDEFSLTCDALDKASKTDMGIYEDSKKEKQAKEKDAKKMTKLQEKLHTDDELLWLNHDKSLREQGVRDSDAVRLRKKFFFSDQNVDRNDPVQLNLMYVQARDDILKSLHPCTVDEAVQFAAMQCQVQLGDHNPDTHLPGSIDLRSYLPEEHSKAKDVARRIFTEHRKLKGMTDLNAKYRYIQLCRSLKTYGMTFFLVKEKVKGKNKLVPRLLGISRDSIMRVDETTKEVIKTWPLTTVRRWAASPNSFTLDFGDYSDEYYSVQTTEGEAISRLIAGYIDFIIKKKKEAEVRPPEDEGASTTTTENISGARGTAIQFLGSSIGRATTTNVGRVGVVQGTRGGVQASTRSGVKAITMGTTGLAGAGPRAGLLAITTGGDVGALAKAEEGLFTARSALQGNIQSGYATVNGCNSDLNNPASLPPLGNDPASIAWKRQTQDINCQNVNAQLAALCATTANIMMLTSADKDQQTLLATGSAVVSMTSNLSELTKGTKLLAALADDEDGSENLLQSARNLADATSKLFQAVSPDSEMERKDLIMAANAVATNTKELLTDGVQLMPKECDVDERCQEELVALAKAVAGAATGLNSAAKNVANRADDPVAQTKVIEAAKAAVVSTSQLVTCTKVLAPTINNMQCQEALVQAAKLLLVAVNDLNNASQAACNDKKATDELTVQAAKMKAAIAALVQRSKNAGEAMDDDLSYEALASDAQAKALTCDINNPDQVSALSTCVGELVRAMQADAERDPDEANKRRLLEAAAALTLACKGLQGNDGKLQELQGLVGAVAAEAKKRKVLRALEVAVKRATQVCTQLIAAATNASATNRNAASQQQLMGQARLMGDQLATLVVAAKAFSADRQQPQAQLGLINESKQAIGPGSRLVATAKVATATVGDQAAAKQLNNFSRAAAVALTELKAAQEAAAEACGSLEIAAALDAVRGLEAQLVAARAQAEGGSIEAQAGETAEAAAMEVAAITKTVGSSMAQLLSAATQQNENYTGIAAKDTTNALTIMAAATKSVAATSKGKMQAEVLEVAVAAMGASGQLIAEAQNALVNPHDPEKNTKLQNAARAVQKALQDVVQALPGQRDIEDALRNVKNAATRLDAGQFPMLKAGETPEQAKARLNTAVLALNAAAAGLVAASRGSPEQLAEATSKYDEAFKEAMRAGEGVAGCSKSEEEKKDTVLMLKQVAVASSALLTATRQVATTPTAAVAKASLTSAARQVQDSIDTLVGKLSTSGPGVRECENAARNIAGLQAALERADEPVSDKSYFDCLSIVNDRSRGLLTSTRNISNSARASDPAQVGQAALAASGQMQELVDAAAQAAYLIGVADPSSTPAVPGCIDAQAVSQSRQAIVDACEKLKDPNNTQPQVLAAATVIAKHTSALCSACKVASAKTSNPVAKQNFVTSAKGIATTTAGLVQAIKALAAQTDDNNHSRCAESTKPLLEAVDTLATLAAAPEFATTPAKITDAAKAKQEPVILAARKMADAGASVADTARLMAKDPSDQAAWGVFTTCSKDLNDAVKALALVIRDNAPGQRECEEAIETLQLAVSDLDQASLAVSVGGLKLRSDNDLQGFQEVMLASCQDISAHMDTVVAAAKTEPQRLGTAVMAFSEQFLPLTSSAMGAASKLADRRKQQQVLDSTKAVAESALSLVTAARGAGGDKNHAEAHGAVDDALTKFQLDMADLTRQLEADAGDAGAISAIMAQLQRALHHLDLEDGAAADGSYGEYNAHMQAGAKKLAATLPALLGATSDQFIDALRDIVSNFNQVAADCKFAAATSDNEENRALLLGATRQLGASTGGLVGACKQLQANPEDFDARKQVSASSQHVSADVAKLFGALQQGAKGIRACENAVQSLEGLVGDLNTTAMFAAAGSLTKESPGDTFHAHKDDLTTHAKDLVDTTKGLVASASGSQEGLADAATKALHSTQQLATTAKRAAVAVGCEDRGAQELLLNGTRDLVVAQQKLLMATMGAVGRPPSDSAYSVLKSEAKGMVGCIMSLTKTVKSVEDEAAKGLRATESAMEAILAELTALDTDQPSRKADATPEQLVATTRGVTLAAAKLVSGANNGAQSEVMQCANGMRKAIVDLLQTGKGTLEAQPDDADQDAQGATKDALRRTADTSLRLLAAVHKALANPADMEAKTVLGQHSKSVAEAVTEVCDAARQLKGEDVEDPDDPHVVAERELLAAAAQIEAAARKLAELRPRSREYSINQDMNFEEMILKAAQGITGATASLMQAAQGAQRELVAQGRINTVRGSERYHDDATWSEGLVSAAKNVAGATSLLCEAANNAVNGEASEERLISSSMAVASSTQQLLLACRVKADKNSKAQERLDTAGRAVKKATDALVKSAKEAAAFQEEHQEVELNKFKVGSIAQEIAMQEAILNKEKELDNARKQLLKLRKQKYDKN